MNLCRKAIVALLLPFCAYSQDAPLSKDAIIQMSKAGLPEDVIVSKIRSEPSPPKMSTDDLISLKSAGVSDGVIRALVSPSPKSDPAVASGPAFIASGDPDDPMANHDPGVYLLMTTREGKRKLVQFERAGSNRTHTAHLWAAAFSYGITKAQVKAELPGPRATLRADPKPEFYMYFPPTGNLGATETISSPSQFILEALDTKKDKREVAVAQMRAFGGTSSGADEKKSLKFNVEKIRPYAYKVTPDASLRSGEYAFIASTGIGGASSGFGGASASVVVFDFGVDR
jgi:hypothetical protein